MREVTAEAYLAIVGAPDASDHEIDAAQYRERYGQTANDLVPRNKYSNEPIEVDGIRFASIAEARRYRDLTRLRDAGEIAELETHPRFELAVNGVLIGRYSADFAYLDLSTGRRIVEDVKSSATAKRRDYVLRRKLMLAIHGIAVVEVER